MQMSFPYKVQLIKRCIVTYQTPTKKLHYHTNWKVYVHIYLVYGIGYDKYVSSNTNAKITVAIVKHNIQAVIQTMLCMALRRMLGEQFSCIEPRDN